MEHISIGSISVRSDKVIGSDIEGMSLRVYLEGVSSPLKQTYTSINKAREAQEKLYVALRLALDK
jgi:hypothetical protein